MRNPVAYRGAVPRRDPPRSDPPDMRLLLQRLASRVEASEADGRGAEGYGKVLLHQAQLLEQVANGSASVTELSDRLGVTPQAVSKVAADLVARGYLLSSPNPDDGRVRMLRLSARGNEFVAAHGKVRANIVREQERWLGTRGFAELVRLLEALRELYEPPRRATD